MESNLENIVAVTNTVPVNEERKETKTRRVGTITVGICMVSFGVMFLLCSVFKIYPLCPKNLTVIARSCLRPRRRRIWTL